MVKKLRNVIFILFIIMFFSSINVYATDEVYEFNVKGTRDYEKAYEVLELLNKERINAGLPEVMMDKYLLENAMFRAAEIVVSFDHVRPNGEYFNTAITQPSLYYAGENIAMGHTTSDYVMTSWMNSQGHKENILKSDFKSVGIGCYIADNGYRYWVQIFSATNAVALEYEPVNMYIEENVEVKYGLLPFWDVNENDYFYDALCYALANKQILGYNSTTFGPYEKMNRAMFVTILWRMEGCPIVSETKTLSDIESGAYYESAVNWAMSTGVIHGFEDGTFRPNQNIKREDIVVILRNYLIYKNVDVSLKNNGIFEGFMDYQLVDEYAKESVKWAVENNIINGKTFENNKYIDPIGESIRADVSCILLNYGLKY